MGTILIAAALFVVVALLVALPLLQEKTPASEPLSPRETLELERETTVRSIRELDLDYRTHKLAEQDYKTLRDSLVQRGAQILRELDHLKAEEQQEDSRDIDAEIEARVAALRQDATDRVDAPAAPVTAAPAAPAEAFQAFCPSCGKPVKSDDSFCAACGARLKKAGRKPQTTRG